MNIVKHTKYIWELEDFIPVEEIDYFLDMFDFYNPILQEEFRTGERIMTHMMLQIILSWII